jgi:hypothetical protein
MELREITLFDLKAGKNWKVLNQKRPWTVEFMENEAELSEASSFSSEDQVLYSGLVAFPSGRIKPILMLKDVGDAGYGGAYWEYVEGHWREVGLEPDPNYELGGKEFMANPLANDPSFDAPDHDFRAANRDGFVRYVASIPQT